MGAVNISSLQRTAETIQPVLQTLPFLVLADVASKLGITVREVTYKDTIREIQRKGGTSKPYPSSGTIEETTEMGKLVERSLIVMPCYNEIYDNILNYRDKGVISPNTGDKVDNQTKKHPLERIILENQVKTIAEDIIDAMYHATRDEDDKSPMGMLDGYFPQIAADIISGLISTNNGNYKTSGAIAGPQSGTDYAGLIALITWIRGAHPSLLKDCDLHITKSAMRNAMDCLDVKLTYKANDGYSALSEHLQKACLAPGLNIITDECLGTGSKLMLVKPGILELGMNTKTDAQFMQVRSIERNPNIVQFYSQWELGARINSVHAKKFFTNEQTNTATDMSGDYTS